MGFFNTKIININPEEKLKEGSLKKESRFRKVWRERWVVLTKTYIYTFKNPSIYQNPKEIIDVQNIKSVKTNDTKNGFCFLIK